MNDVEMTYSNAKDQFLKAKAQGAWRTAQMCVVRMIETCPCEEAFPQLQAWLEECDRRAEIDAMPRWKRWLLGKV